MDALRRARIDGSSLILNKKPSYSRFPLVYSKAAFIRSAPFFHAFHAVIVNLLKKYLRLAHLCASDDGSQGADAGKNAWQEAHYDGSITQKEHTR